MERIRRIRQLDSGHNFTLVCRDLSELAAYARVDNSAFRLLKSLAAALLRIVVPLESEEEQQNREEIK